MADKIRDFFKRKKVNQEFKSAGPGRRLTEDSLRHVSATHQQSAPLHHRPRQPPKESKAGAAALARVEEEKLRQNPDWSRAAIRAQARRELELEQQAKERAKHDGIETVFTESAPVLAVNGVYFTCPLVGPDVLPQADIELKIKEFLYEQLCEEKGLTSCLIIHTCNKNKQQLKVGIETLSKYLNNIVEHPEEEKYQKIRISNRNFQERVLNLEGGLDFLLAAGFEEQRLEKDGMEENYLVFPKHKLEDIEYLKTMIDALHTAEPIVPVLDRSVRVLIPSEGRIKISLPEEFYTLSAEEIARLQEKREHEVELATQLRTKAMRIKDEIKENRHYHYTLVRVRLPDGFLLQGTFYTRETLGDVKEFLNEHLSDPSIKYHLHAPGGEKLSSDESTLFQLNLVPAAVINLTWSDDDDDLCKKQCSLKEETVALLQQL